VEVEDGGFFRCSICQDSIFPTLRPPSFILIDSSHSFALLIASISQLIFELPTTFISVSFTLPFSVRTLSFITLSVLITCVFFPLLTHFLHRPFRTGLFFSYSAHEGT
jgi:hypothetical protein